ncbi:PQQ-binding-like beta-propeller repeat protein [Streptomyces sp. NPDC015346]|uniref:outer membrane protein assembly factor BamB family protein n=1 Tax=Streptomyces sp. NPDC015346 TaxID=3364954 RepID=UPI0036F5B72F
MTAQVDDVPSGRRTRRSLATRAAALVALCSLTAGCFLFGDEAEEMGVVWDTIADPKAEEQGNGAWLSGDTLVRSRFDAVSGYNARDGKRTWEYVPPGRSAICHAAADTKSSVLVLTRDGDGATASAKGKSCATDVALDMKNGRELWRAPHSVAESRLHYLQSSEVSVGGGIAVDVKGADLRAVDVRTGKPRWKAALPKGCVPGTPAVAERQVAALLACGGTAEPRYGEKIPTDAELQVAAFAPGSGALLWSTPLGGRLTVPWDARAEFVSADPVVVAASRSGDSDSGAYFSFSGNGRPNPPIDFSGPYGEIQSGDRLTAAVDDSRLYTLTFHRVRNSRVDAHRLTAFDLATGELLWGGTVDDDRLGRRTAYRILPQDGKLTVLTVPTTDHRLYVLDAATGDQRDAHSFPEGNDSVDTVFAYEDWLIGARHGSDMAPSKPFTAYKRP